MRRKLKGRGTYVSEGLEQGEGRRGFGGFSAKSSRELGWQKRWVGLVRGRVEENT